jgi:hypothetical protein
MPTGQVIKWTTAGAVLGFAVVAAVASYENAYDLVRMHGESSPASGEAIFVTRQRRQ